jgi:hypothetical protein
MPQKIESQIGNVVAEGPTRVTKGKETSVYLLSKMVLNYRIYCTVTRIVLVFLHLLLLAHVFASGSLVMLDENSLLFGKDWQDSPVRVPHLLARVHHPPVRLYTVSIVLGPWMFWKRQHQLDFLFLFFCICVCVYVWFLVVVFFLFFSVSVCCSSAL